MKEEVVITTQLTGKRLKLNKLIAWAFIAVGIILILMGTDKHSIAWGSLLSLYGFGHLAVTRIRIWWNYK